MVGPLGARVERWYPHLMSASAGCLFFCVQQDEHPGVRVAKQVEPAHAQSGVGAVLVGAQAQHPAQGVAQGAVAQISQVLGRAAASRDRQPRFSNPLD